ncbi:hypothetical protein OAS86_02425 [Gammaproteobacteria bacterium]|nr:hypothetical protein [Gammaproteobacteria bacterium]
MESKRDDRPMDIENPTHEDVRSVIAETGLTSAEIARRLRLGNQGGRTVRRWQQHPDDKGASRIPWAVWAWLLVIAGRETPETLGLADINDQAANPPSILPRQR